MRIAIATLLLSGCHREAMNGDLTVWSVLLLGIVFLAIIWRIDQWRLEAGYSVEPAPYVGMNEPTTIQAKVLHEADKQDKQQGEPQCSK